MNKRDFRNAQIDRLTAHQLETAEASAALLDKLVQSDVWQQARTIATTVSSPIEVATQPLIAAAQAAGKQVYLPKTMPHRQMAFLPDPGPEQRITSAFGIPEPAYEAALQNQTVDLVIVPGIAFARDSHYRVGFGGGYYDRFLAQYPGHTVSLVAPVQLFDTAEWDVESFDIPLQQLITLD